MPIFSRFTQSFSRLIRDMNGEKKNISLLMIFFTVSFSRFASSRRMKHTFMYIFLSTGKFAVSVLVGGSLRGDPVGHFTHKNHQLEAARICTIFCAHLHSLALFYVCLHPTAFMTTAFWNFRLSLRLGISLDIFVYTPVSSFVVSRFACSVLV